jgi:hypothetical protein
MIQRKPRRPREQKAVATSNATGRRKKRVRAICGTREREDATGFLELYSSSSSSIRRRRLAWWAGLDPPMATGSFGNQKRWLDRPAVPVVSCKRCCVGTFPSLSLSLSLSLWLMIWGMVAPTEQTHESLLSSLANRLHRSAAGRHACRVRSSNGCRYAAARFFFLFFYRV